MKRIFFLIWGAVALAVPEPVTGGSFVITERTVADTSSTVSRARDVLSVSCEGVPQDARGEALCRSLYRQIKGTVPGYVYRRVPAFDDAPARRGDVRVRLVVLTPGEDMTLQLEWYSGARVTPVRGSVIRVDQAATPEEITDALEQLVSGAAGFRAPRP